MQRGKRDIICILGSIAFARSTFNHYCGSGLGKEATVCSSEAKQVKSEILKASRARCPLKRGELGFEQLLASRCALIGRQRPLDERHCSDFLPRYVLCFKPGPSSAVTRSCAPWDIIGEVKLLVYLANGSCIFLSLNGLRDFNFKGYWMQFRPVQCVTIAYYLDDGLNRRRTLRALR